MSDSDARFHVADHAAQVVKCSECGTPQSPYVAKCPRCGHHAHRGKPGAWTWGQTIGFIVLGVLIIVAVLAGIWMSTSGLEAPPAPPIGE